MTTPTKSTKFSPSDVTTLLLAIGALAMAWTALQNLRQPRAHVPVATPVPEWGELVRIATWIPSEAHTSTNHAIIVFVEPGCRDCEAVLTAIDRLRQQLDVSLPVGYIQFPHSPSAGTFGASVLAECINEQGRLPEYLHGLFLTSDLVTYAAAARETRGLDKRRLDQCVKESAAGGVVNRHIMAARQLGLRQTPAVLLDGFLLLPPLSASSLDSAWQAIAKN